MSEKYRLFYKIASLEEESEVVAEKVDVAGPGYAFGIDNESNVWQEVLRLHAHVVDSRKMGRL